MGRAKRGRVERFAGAVGVGASTAAVALAVAACIVAASGCRGSGALPSPSAPSVARRTVAGSAAVVGAQADCRPAFHDQDGWLGGDVAASIPLGGRKGRRSVWLFGDSFVAGLDRPNEPPPERHYPFVHNAIAVSRCDARGRWTLDFAWDRELPRRNREVAPRPTPSAHSPATRTSIAYFEPDPRAAWVAQVQHDTGEAPYYWPLSGVAIGDALYVALLRVAPSPARGPFRLPFRPAGVDLARIEPTAGPPETWSMRLSALSSRADLLPATSLVVEGEYLLAYATLDRGDGRAPRVLVRIPLAALAGGAPDLEPFAETLAADGRWRAGLDAGAAGILMDDDASEMSVHFDPGLREWLAVYGDPAQDTIWLRRAERPEGPWSPRIALLRIPELAAAEDPLPGEPFCYAGKAHPELAPSGELVVSYVCNVFAERDDRVAEVLERLRTTGWIYRPKLVRVPLPPG